MPRAHKSHLNMQIAHDRKRLRDHSEDPAELARLTHCRRETLRQPHTEARREGLSLTGGQRHIPAVQSVAVHHSTLGAMARNDHSEGSAQPPRPRPVRFRAVKVGVGTGGVKRPGLARDCRVAPPLRTATPLADHNPCSPLARSTPACRFAAPATGATGWASWPFTAIGVNLYRQSPELGILILPGILQELIVAASFLLRPRPRRAATGWMPRARGLCEYLRRHAVPPVRRAPGTRTGSGRRR